MSKEFTLTKEEFITRSMAGEVFIHNSTRYFYDNSKNNPFRIEDSPLSGNWENLDGKTLFTLEEPKPIIERRWRWQYDHPDGSTNISARYMSDEYTVEKNYVVVGWFKREHDYVDVEVER